MARKSIVIMTPSEKKEAVKAAREAVREAKAELSTVNKARKQLDKQYNADVRASDRLIKAAEKALTKAEADLLKIAPPPAPKKEVAEPSPVGV